MITHLLLPVVVVLVGAAALARTRDLLPTAPAGRRAVAVAVWGVAGGALVLTPQVETWMRPLPGWPNAAEPLARSFLMLAGTGAQAIFQLTNPAGDARRRVRWRAGVFAVALIAYWTCFLTAPARPDSTVIYLDYAHDPQITAMQAIALTFLGWSFLDLLVGWRRFVSRTRAPLRTGLAMMALGAVCGCLWVLVRAVGQLAAVTSQQALTDASVAPGVALASLTALLTVVGVVWPSTLHRLGQARAWWRAWRALGHLAPLHRDLAKLRPDLMLEEPSGPVRERLHLRDVRWRLYRWLIEIRDVRRYLGRRLLGARRRAHQRLAASGRPMEDARIEGEALAEVITQIDLDASAAPLRHALPPAAPGRTREILHDQPDLTLLSSGARPTAVEAEAAYFSAVATHYRHAVADATTASLGQHSPTRPATPKDTVTPEAQQDVNRAGDSAAARPASTSARDRVAVALSEVLAPWVFAGLMPPLVGALTTTPWWNGLLLGVLAATFSAVIPYALILRGVRRGRFTDRHISRRRDRPLLLAVIVALVVISLIAVSALGGSSALVALVVVMIACAAVGMVVSAWWKLSMHTVVMAGSIAVLAMTVTPWALVLVLPLLVLAWARVRIHAHTPAQAGVGALTGAVLAAALTGLVVG